MRAQGRRRAQTWIIAVSFASAAAPSTASAEEIDETVRPAPVAQESASAEPDESVLVTAALLAGGGFSGRYGPGFGTRIGFLIPVGPRHAFGSGDAYVGGGFVYHRATDPESRPPGEIEGWLVSFAGEVGYGLHLPIVTVTPVIGFGVVRSSTTMSVEVVCNTESEAAPHLSPAIVLQSSPTSPLAPFFIGADGRYATSFGAEGLQAVILFGTAGVRL